MYFLTVLSANCILQEGFVAITSSNVSYLPLIFKFSNGGR